MIFTAQNMSNYKHIELLKFSIRLEMNINRDHYGFCDIRIGNKKEFQGSINSETKKVPRFSNFCIPLNYEIWKIY
jgi:hypothetical protein